MDATLDGQRDGEMKKINQREVKQQLTVLCAESVQTADTGNQWAS